MKRKNLNTIPSLFAGLDLHCGTISPSTDHAYQQEKHGQNLSRRNCSIDDRRRTRPSVASAESAAAPLLFAREDSQESELGASLRDENSSRIDFADQVTGIRRRKPRPVGTCTRAVHTIRDGEEALGYGDGRLYRAVFAQLLIGQTCCEVRVGAAEILKVLYSNKKFERRQKETLRREVRRQLDELEEKGYIKVLRRGDCTISEPTTYIAYSPDEALRRQIESGFNGWIQTGKRTRMLVRLVQEGKPVGSEIRSARIQRLSRSKPA